jgi:hypothetical protein
MAEAGVEEALAQLNSCPSNTAPTGNGWILTDDLHQIATPIVARRSASGL